LNGRTDGVASAGRGIETTSGSFPGRARETLGCAVGDKARIAVIASAEEYAVMQQHTVIATEVGRMGALRKPATALLLGAAALAAFPAWADAPAPIKLAIFDFELEDFSAGASVTGQSPADTTDLKNATDQIRRLLAQSGRYRLIDGDNADAAAAKDHALHDCNGCDAAIAMKLGADESFVGTVKRISRMEYTVRFAIRDARTGAVVADADSGLRMGANYSWSRGAAQLVSDRLLGRSDQQ
jgi:hypothetical protein